MSAEVTLRSVNFKTFALLEIRLIALEKLINFVSNRNVIDMK